MSQPSSPNLPPRPDTYPGGTMPDHCIGGQVQAAQGEGTARLLDVATGTLAMNVMDNELPLFQFADGNWYYRFDGVPTGKYKVVVTLEGSPSNLTSDVLSPGMEGNVAVS